MKPIKAHAVEAEDESVDQLQGEKAHARGEEDPREFL